MAALKVRALRAQCEALAGDLVQQGQAPADAIAAVRPGGSDNPKRDVGAWVRFYGQLQLLRGRAQGGASGSGAGAGSTADDSLTLAALAATPATVRIGDADRAVYPKSLSALLHCHARDAVLGKLAVLLAALKDADANDEHAELVHEAVAEIDTQTQILCWIALTDGPGLPFSSHVRQPEPPAEIADLSPLEVLEINRAFARVNWVNLRAMQSLLEPDDDDSGKRSTRPSWSIFMGSLAIELHEDPTTLIERRALVSVMASTSLAASSRRAAMNDAKREAAARREDGR